MAYDLANSLSVVQLTDPANTTGSITSATLDTHLTIGSAMLFASMGASADTLSSTVYWDLIIEDSSDDSTWTAVTATDRVSFADVAAGGIYQVVNTAALDDAAYAIGYTGPERYVRIKATKTGTHTNGTVISIYGVVQNIHKPTSGSDNGSATG